jgi:hypothetical protein
MNLTEAAHRVIDLARKVRDYYAAELPKRHPNYPLVDTDDESVAPPTEEAELREFLATLPDEAVYRLILIMYLGRGDFAVPDLATSYDALKRAVGTPRDAAAEMMLYKATLADELSDGLDELRRHGISADKMPLTKMKVRKR